MSSLKDRLLDFDKLVDELEDWLLPVLEHTESKKFMEQDLPIVGDQLKVRIEAFRVSFFYSS